MQKSTRSMATALVATAIGFGSFAMLGSQTSVVLAGPTHEKLHDADKACEDALDYLKSAPHDFHGKKDECIKRLMEARHQLKLIWEDMP